VGLVNCDRLCSIVEEDLEPVIEFEKDLSSVGSLQASDWKFSPPDPYIITVSYSTSLP
jgi:hypothetical protein